MNLREWCDGALVLPRNYGTPCLGHANVLITVAFLCVCFDLYIYAQ